MIIFDKFANYKNAFNKLQNEKQAILWNGTNQLKSSVREYDKTGKIRFLIIGRISKRKGQFLSIQAISLLNETGAMQYIPKTVLLEQNV